MLRSLSKHVLLQKRRGGVPTLGAIIRIWRAGGRGGSRFLPNSCNSVYLSLVDVGHFGRCHSACTFSVP